MENPDTWNEVQKTIADAKSKHYQLLSEGFCGVSEVTAIYMALIRAGFLKPEYTK